MAPATAGGGELDFVTVLGTCGQGVEIYSQGLSPEGTLCWWDGEWGWGVRRDFFCSENPRKCGAAFCCCLDTCVAKERDLEEE